MLDDSRLRINPAAAMQLDNTSAGLFRSTFQKINTSFHQQHLTSAARIPLNCTWRFTELSPAYHHRQVDPYALRDHAVSAVAPHVRRDLVVIAIR